VVNRGKGFLWESCARRQAVRLSGILGCLFLASPRAEAQEDQDRRIVSVLLASEGGGRLDQVSLSLEVLGDEAPRQPGSVLSTEGGGAAILDLSAGVEYDLRVSAPGHLERVVRIASSGPATVRVVLSVDPYELPTITAAVGGRVEGPENRTVHQALFHEESLTYSTVAEWLRDVPGVSVRGSGAGARQVLSVRGSRPQAVLVLLDGVALNDPLTGQADLSMIPASSLESGTLIPGSGSMLYGAGAAAGVLLLQSRVAHGSGLGGGIQMASFGGLGFDAQADVVSGARRVGFSVSASRAENDFPYRGTGVQGTSDTWSNAGVGSAHAAIHAASGVFFGNVRFDGADRGTPGRAGTSLFAGARARERSWIAAAGVDRPNVRSSFSYARRRMGYRPSDLEPYSVQEVRELRVSGELNLPTVPVTLGARAAGETLEGEQVEGSVGRASGGLRVAAIAGPERFRVVPGLSVDVSAGRLVASPEVSVTWLATGALRAWGRAGQGFRMPTFGDLYFASRYQMRANPDLQPERIDWDGEIGAGLRTRAGGLELEASAAGWSRRTSDPIVWLASSTALWSPSNLGRLMAAGVDIELELSSREPGPVGWRAQVAGSAQRSRVGFGSNRNPLPYDPDGHGRLSLEAWLGAAGARLDLRYTGSRTTSLAATRELPAFATIDASARYGFRMGDLDLGVYGKIVNVLDQRFELVELYPEPGRQFALRLEARRSSS